MFVTTSARIGCASVAVRAFCRSRVSIRRSPIRRLGGTCERDEEDEMGYRLIGRVHARLAALQRPGWRERGQGTVEYVALILLVAALLAGVVAATKGKSFGTGQIAETIVKQIKNALDTIK
jgi:hypothetical protein